MNSNRSKVLRLESTEVSNLYCVSERFPNVREVREGLVELRPSKNTSSVRSRTSETIRVSTAVAASSRW